jgi:Fic family protein
MKVILVVTYVEKIERSGQYVVSDVGGEKVRSFIPNPLPPIPSINYEGLLDLIEQAGLALGKLDGLSRILPDTRLFLYLYVRKEAVLSSQIEGTQSSLSDLLLYEAEEAPGVPINDVEEVSSYVSAMNYGLKQLDTDFPLSLRLVRGIHKVLLTNSRGREKQPGEFRTSQNWIGGSRPGNAIFVPPPPNQVTKLMGELEKFIHSQKDNTPNLVKAGIIHLQFETIHPFLDGNGRLGRLLITLFLRERGLLDQPLLYLSLYLKTHRNRYYELLQKVRNEGVWEEWLEFFLTGIIETSNQATQTAAEIIELFKNDEEKIKTLGGATASAMRVHQYAQLHPIIKIPAASKELGISQPTVTTSINHLRKLKILQEIGRRARNRTYFYSSYIDVLSEGTQVVK